MKKSVLLLIAIGILSIMSCHQEFLNMKPDKKLVVPANLNEIQALLDNTSIMNESMPSLGEIGSDDYYVLDNRLMAQLSRNRNTYLWAEDLFEGNNADDWDFRYRQVFYANVALEQLVNVDVPQSSKQLADNVKGSALFYRAWAFFQVAQLFSKTYDFTTNAEGKGVPLRLESNITIPTKRASVEDTYSQIIHDLSVAATLLPKNPVMKTRPSKSAAWGLLARTSLIMGNYDKALAYADSSLTFYDGNLIDYNDLDTSLDFPFGRFNREVIFHATMFGSTILNQSYLIVDSILFNDYEDGDIRKVAFFRQNQGLPTFKGSYDNSRTLFAGIALNEVIMIKAESLARLGRNDEAIETLNYLLAHRYQEGSFNPEMPDNLLRKVLHERRKELVYRGLRWSDLRRLNLEPEFQKTLIRNVQGESYELRPNDSRYVLPIPDPVIAISNMVQNPR